MAQALSDGVRRVLSAPALLASVTAAALLYPLHPYAAPRLTLIAYAVVCAFLSGGIIDRYARGRPTRGYGFFGASGRHAGAMLRLTAIEILLYLVADNLPLASGAIAAAAVINLFALYARVRIVVEDRRSAFGALLASTRFIRRNPASIAVYAVWTAAIAAAALVARGAAPVLALPLLASATIFFQSRLAHAGYAAAPVLEWPDSPAAEALANRR